MTQVEKGHAGDKSQALRWRRQGAWAAALLKGNDSQQELLLSTSTIIYFEHYYSSSTRHMFCPGRAGNVPALFKLLNTLEESNGLILIG